MINKYPRTLHLPFSPEVHSDDKVINFKDLNNLLNKEYVVLEKMDGQNNCLKGLDTNTNNYGGVFARTHTQETQLPNQVVKPLDFLQAIHCLLHSDRRSMGI